MANQTITVQYFDDVDSDVVNKRFLEIRQRGIYNGGYLTKVSDVQVSLSTLICEIGDADNQVRGETTAVKAVTVSTTLDYVILRWGYVASAVNEMTIAGVATGSITDNDLIVGKCVFSGATLTGFDYSERTNPAVLNKFLVVEPTETPSMKVRVKGGHCNYGTSNFAIDDQETSVITAPSVNPRIDLVYINNVGGVAIESGSEAASPTAPSYTGKIVLAEITLQTSSTSITSSMITDVRNFIGGAGFFTELSDTPSSYSGEAGKCVLVNSTEDGLEFGYAKYAP